MQLKDFTTDEGLVFLLPLKEAGVVPEWVQEIPEKADVEGLPSSAFADPSNRLFPIHDKRAAWLSAVSSYVYGCAPGLWSERLKSACHAYDITEQIKKAIDALRPEDYQQAAPKQKEKTAHAIEIVIHEGEDPKPFYNISTPYHIEKSASQLAKDMLDKRLPGAWLHEAAVNIVKAASAHGVSASLLPSTVKDLGEERLPSPDYISRQIELRKSAGVPDEACALYKEIAKQALDGDLDQYEAVLQWEIIDRNFGLEGNDKLATPVRAFCSGELKTDVEKMASSVVMVDDTPVPMAALKILPERLVVASLPKQAASCVLAAMGEEDGRSASKRLTNLDKESSIALMRLLLHADAD